MFLILAAALFSAFPLPSFAEETVEYRIFGNHVYDDETILKIAGADYQPLLDPEAMRRRLETTGYFSRVRVAQDGGRRTILVREKTPWFVFPYLASDSHQLIYGAGGGMIGLGGGHTQLVGRAQHGSSSNALAMLYRDEFFLDSFWIVGASLEFEDADHDVFEGREVVRHVPNRAVNLAIQTGYHLRPNLSVRFDTHVESHRFDDHGVQSGSQHSHRILAEYGTYYLEEGLARGQLVVPYVEFTPPWSHFQFFQFGISGQRSVWLSGEKNWIARARFEQGSPLPFYQRFEVGGARLRGYPSQAFRTSSYLSQQNDFLISSWTFWKMKVRPVIFGDIAYVNEGTRAALGTGIQVYLRQVAVPAIQVYAGYGFNPKGVSVIATIGPQL